jgi:L-fuconolactonase
MRIDAHAHLWDPAVRDYPWMRGRAMDPLRGPRTAADLRAVTAPHGVDGVILVQTVAEDAETAEFLALARAGHAVGVVGWAELAGGALDTPLLDDPLLVGLRHQVEDEPDPHWLLRADVRRSLAELGRRGLVYDLLVRAPARDAALRTARDCPQVAFVLDHAGKPGIAAGEWEPWAGWISALAACPNVACKLSGLVTEARRRWAVEDIRPYAEHVLDAFGAERVLFGSDWPVCSLAGGYTRVVELVDALLAGASAGERAAVLGGAARRVYRL